MKIAKQNVIVAVDCFSGFISTCFAKSENSNDLLEGLIQTIYPFKSSSMASIRVDKAPGFRKLMKKKPDLTEVGLELEHGDAKNRMLWQLQIGKLTN